eukprot:3960092-Amphidinium_carterae.1
MVCEGVESIAHIVRECTRHSFCYHRIYLDQLVPLSAERIARNGVPLLSQDILDAGYEAYACYMNSVMSTLLQRDIDNANVGVRVLSVAPAQGSVRRRLRGKQRPPVVVPTMSSLGIRRRLTCKQPRPVAYDRSSHSTAQVRKVHNTVVNRFLADIRFNDDGVWHINGHSLVRDGSGESSTLTCTCCHHHKLWRWTPLGRESLQGRTAEEIQSEAEFDLDVKAQAY